MRAHTKLHALLALGLFCVALGAACRDASEPFQPVDREAPVDADGLRLTYGVGDDRTPLWSADGDSVYFTTSEWEGNPLAPSTVVALAADGLGSLTTVIRNVQEGVGRTNWIDAPALDETRLAFVRVRPLLEEAPCTADRRVCPRMESLPMVRLQRAEVHVRAIDATIGLADDQILELLLDGHSEEADSTAPTGVIAVSDYHPFQFQFESEGRAFFRPSWNPDATELVVSDGLRLLRWVPGAAEATPIAGTADGISPAWSPNGDWIAYTRHERLSSETFMCEYETDYNVGGSIVAVTTCLERRTVYETAPPQIVLVRPDGSEQIVLGEGQDPAWSPDGSAVYASVGVASNEHIVRIPVGGGAATVIPNTEGGIEPAVSPDGARLAFSRSAHAFHGQSRDIWIVELP